jgi:hypothetical protein
VRWPWLSRSLCLWTLPAPERFHRGGKRPRPGAHVFVGCLEGHGIITQAFPYRHRDECLKVTILACRPCRRGTLLPYAGRVLKADCSTPTVMLGKATEGA